MSPSLNGGNVDCYFILFSLSLVCLLAVARLVTKESPLFLFVQIVTSFSQKLQQQAALFLFYSKNSKNCVE